MQSYAAVSGIWLSISDSHFYILSCFFSDRTRYFSRVAMPPRIWRSCLLVRSTCCTPSYNTLFSFCKRVVISLCTVDFDTPNCAAARRTVAFSSIMYLSLIHIYQYHMGITAENVAEKYGITREMQDQIGYESQMKAAKAISSGRFKDEIVPIEVKKKKETVIFDTDEHCRPQTTLEGLAKLRPAFKKDGTVTAGNASGINDAGAAMIIASEDFVLSLIHISRPVFS